MSFQKRANESLQNSSPQKDPTKSTGIINAPKSALRENRKAELVPESNRPSLTSPGQPTSLQRSTSFGALQAAATAAQRKGAANPTPLGSPLRTHSKKPPGTIVTNGSSSLQPKITMRSSKGAELAAAKASVQRSNNMPLQTTGNDSQFTSLVAASPTPLTIDPSISIIKHSKPAFQENRLDVSSTAAQLSIAPPKLPITSNPSAPPQASTQAARTVAMKPSQSVPSRQQADREARFGVILSRSVSPAPERNETLPIGRISPPKSHHPMYQLPEAAASEPLLRTYSSSAALSVVRTHKPSPLVPIPSRPRIGVYESSSEASSLADVGAFTAMSSRSSSATSLPITLSETIDSQNHVGGAARRRPVHLKATMRKEARPEREKSHIHAGPICISEPERKRYEGVWASNHCQDSVSLLSEESKYIDNLTVRELWIRSSLPDEFLGHIWYVPERQRSPADGYRDLVDQNKKGKLTREEFVVGMWLIDQSLGGRKLPLTVVPSDVWHSAQRLKTFTRH